MGFRAEARGNAVVGGILVLVTVTVLASVLGLALYGGESMSNGRAASLNTTPNATATATAAPEPREVTIRFEVQGEHVMAMATGGEDLDAVDSFEVNGANMTTRMDPTTDTPRAYGTAERPTTIRVTATFEDGTTQVVGEKELD